MTVISSKSLCLVLLGDYRALDSAFFWSTTPQGWSHWDERYQGRVPLGGEDYAFLTRAANTYEERRRRSWL